jgi:AcrR family transcriptional regulator
MSRVRNPSAAGFADPGPDCRDGIRRRVRAAAETGRRARRRRRVQPTGRSGAVRRDGQPPLKAGATSRNRLLAGMAKAILKLGHEKLTVADVVRLARVSKRTFYEHFTGKDDCFVALYVSNSDGIIQAVDEAVQSVEPGKVRLETGVTAYLAALQVQPKLVRAMLLGILRVGPRGLAARRAVNSQYAKLLLREIPGAEFRTGPRITTAVVGGINELLIEAIEDNRSHKLTDLADDVLALLEPFYSTRD